ncbi:TPA: hypothetical protein ACH3X3_008533 [Trebouxia sp. C0006]
MSVRQRLLRGVKLVESALASYGKGFPHSKGFQQSVRLTAVHNPSDRSLATPATYALFGGLAAYAFYINNPAALAEATVTVPHTVETVSVAPVDAYVRPTNLKGLPKEVILYQYEVCPFCCKVKAFLDYNQIPYRTVEVSPLYKKELKWSEHKKVPVAVLDGDVVQDSSVIISRLAAEIEASQQSLQSHQPSPPGTSSGSSSSSGSRSWLPWSKKDSQPIETEPESGSQIPDNSPTTTQREEEAYWRQWVDQRLVKVITVNIYGTAKEAFQTFDYISATGKFSWFEAESARVAGAVMMWGISNKLKKKYGIQGNLREELYVCGDQWVKALDGRNFLGGNQPNLADLAVFGVVKSVTGTDTFHDLLHKTDISEWYERMMAEVPTSSRVSTS